MAGEATVAMSHMGQANSSNRFGVWQCCLSLVIRPPHRNQAGLRRKASFAQASSAHDRL